MPVAAAVVRVFIEHGDRTDRKKARLKYVLDRFGLEKYLEETQKHLKFPLRKFPLDRCEPRGPVARLAHVGFHPQRQEGLCYVGVVLPVGRMRADQMRALADIAERFGSGSIRWTVWQNLIISDIPTENIPDVKRAIEAAGLHWSATNVRAGLDRLHRQRRLQVCRLEHEAARHGDCRLSRRPRAAGSAAQYPCDRLPQFVRQHYIGDIGLLATKVSVGEEMVEGYHVYVGGGYGEQRNIGRELYRDVVADELPPLVERMLLGYLDHRAAPEESFHDYTRREPTETLLQHFEVGQPIASVNVMTVPMIPESAPFQPEQRAWLNGFSPACSALADEWQRRRQRQYCKWQCRQRSNGVGRGRCAAGRRRSISLARSRAARLPERLTLAEGKPIERRLMAAMAQLDCGACGYLCKTYSEAIARGDERDLTRCTPGGSDTAKALKKILAARGSEPAPSANGQNGHAAPPADRQRSTAS